MKKITVLATVIGSAFYLSAFARADDIQFITLPKVVQTSVIKETHITDPTSVTRVVRAHEGIYAVTVRGDAGERVVYVNETGTIVQAPATSTAVEEKVQTVQPAAPTTEAVVTYDQVQKNESQYQLIEKKGKKEIYLDKQTGQKVTVKREND